MKNETKTCQNCHKDFIIEPDDFLFYEKIGVPAPTFCPECRTIRRLCWRNEMSLFKRKCDVPGHNETLISAYSPEAKIITYDLKSWWGDSWDPLDYGKDYDFSKPFFEQWKELLSNIPMQTLGNSKATNSDYCNVAEESKDSYMCSASWKIERSFYSNRIEEIKDSSDLYVVHKSELCYEDILCTNCYHTLYSINCKDCVDSYFLYDCHGCTNCFGCTNLRNKSYCMWNEQLSKDEYNSRLAEIDLLSFKEIESLKDKFRNLCLKSIHRFTTQIKTVNSTGDYLENVKNCKSCFNVSGKAEDLKYTHWSVNRVKEMYDSGPGIGLMELGYEIFDTGAGGGNILFGSVVYYGHDIQYSFNCYGCSNLFGCIGLRNKNYCILNRQYSKKEYEELIPKIKQQMSDLPYVDQKGIVYKYGEFFPAELSPFAYNETQAQDYFPKTKEQALKEGYRWRSDKNTDYKVTIKSIDLPDNLEDVNNDILDEVIECAHKGQCEDRCKGAFKITKDELTLYKKLGVPLPRLCFSCRHDTRLRKCNPMKLWHRTCTKEGCNNEFETSYSPDRPEIVYCEECYKKEIY